MDENLQAMTREALIDEAQRLRQGIRRHRDSSPHELCRHHPDLWGLLPERTDPVPVVPAWAQLTRGCMKYRQSLDAQALHAPRRTRIERFRGRRRETRADRPRRRAPAAPRA